VPTFFGLLFDILKLKNLSQNHVKKLTTCLNKSCQVKWFGAVMGGGLKSHFVTCGHMAPPVKY
jgi:hypothetical protein